MQRKKLNNIIEKYRMIIYDTNSLVTKIVNILSAICYALVSFSFIYAFSFYFDSDIKNILHNIFKFSLIFYFLRYIINYIYSDIEFKKYLPTNLFNSILFFSTIILYLFSLFSNEIYILLFKLILSIYLLLDFSRFVSLNISKIKISNQAILIVSFLLLIFVGTILLTFPKMTKSGQSIDFITSLFLSVSASCVTGLSVIDITEVFTLKGKFILMILIQLGGLNIIMFASFFSLLLRKGNNLRYHNILKENLKSKSILDNKSIIKKVFSFIITIELVGALLIYFNLPSNEFNSQSEMIFHSFFHSISAFNNAGFSSFNSDFHLNCFRHLHYLQIVIIFLIIFGGIGFTVVSEILSWENIKSKYKRISISTKVILKMTFLFIIFGTIAFFVLENNNTLKGLSISEKIITSIFQSVTTRTAGFNTVDISLIKIPTIIIFMFFMFIGTAPASTGGGIKITTFFALYRYGISFLKQKNKIEYNKYIISFDSINKAMVTFIFAVFFIFISIFFISITDNHIPFHKLIFEVVSAFATVGLSMGITADISTLGRIILIFCMFIGRVGLLTFGLSIANKSKDLNYKYTKTDLII